MSAVDYRPREIQSISLFKIDVKNKNVCELQADIIFEPAEGNIDI